MTGSFDPSTESPHAAIAPSTAKTAADPMRIARFRTPRIVSLLLKKSLLSDEPLVYALDEEVALFWAFDRRALPEMPPGKRH